MHHTRTQLYEHMDELHRLADVNWRLYSGNRNGEDTGPAELNRCDWYKRNTNWGPWLQRVSRWAVNALSKLNQLLKELNKQCALAHLLFGDEVECMDEVLYLAVEETKELLGYFSNGWRVMLFSMRLTEWCDFGSSIMMMHI